MMRPRSTRGGTFGYSNRPLPRLAYPQGKRRCPKLRYRRSRRSAAGSVRGCYERALRQNQMLQGKLMVAVKVGAQGQTCGASLASDTLGDGAVASCVLQKFRSGTFPAPIGGCVDVQVPINFTPKT